MVTFGIISLIVLGLATVFCLYMINRVRLLSRFAQNLIDKDFSYFNALIHKHGSVNDFMNYALWSFKRLKKENFQI